MSMRSLCSALIVATATSLTAAAHAQSVTAAPTQTMRPATVGGLTARAPDLQPIPSRIEHGVVSVRNTGSAASVASVITVNCHLPGQRGGCVDVPDELAAPYINVLYPNRITVNVPAIQPGHVYNHTLSFWDDIAWPSGSYQFDFAADAGGTNAETNEGNNTGSHTWVVP